MVKKGDNKISGRGNQDDLPGYKHYPQEEDVYLQDQVDHEIDPEVNSRKKTPAVDEVNEKSFDEEVSGADLDIPGAELDDLLEDIGSEDEENNYYSIGGDEHHNLEEDQGEDRR